MAIVRDKTGKLEWDYGGDAFSQGGMTLRAWFAGQALAALIQTSEPGDMKAVAAAAYRYADLMLEQNRADFDRFLDLRETEKQEAAAQKHGTAQ